MIRLILIDDHALVREGFKSMLQSSDVSVVGEASSVVEGLQIIERCPCDLVVSDFALPDYEASWLVGQLRKRQIAVPILMLSQYTDYDKVRQIMALGASGYIVKTATREEFMQAVTVVAAGGIYVHPAVAPALRARQDGGSAREQFSVRERAILQLLVEGLSNPAIAGRLNVSLGTVKGDLQGMFAKLAVTDRTRLVATALARGLVEPPDPQ